MKKSRSIVVALLAVLILTLAFGVQGAYSQSSQDGYNQPGPSAIDQTDGDDPGDGSSAEEPSSSEELPFTGLDLGLLAAAGASLLLLGLGMRRITRGPNSV